VPLRGVCSAQGKRRAGAGQLDPALLRVEFLRISARENLEGRGGMPLQVDIADRILVPEPVRRYEVSEQHAAYVVPVLIVLHRITDLPRPEDALRVLVSAVQPWIDCHLADLVTRADADTRFVGLDRFIDRRADELGGPHRKRLELAKALAMDPKVLLCDEVMAGLNLVEIDEVIDVIRRVRERGISVLVIEHVIKAIKSLSDRLLVLHHGEKIADDKPDAVLSDERVIQAYLGRRRE